MSASGLRASVVMVGYNSAAFVGHALDSLLIQTTPLAEFEVVFVDNASSDGTAEAVEAYRDRLPHLTIIRNPTNVGFAGGVNVGAAQARAPILVLLNPDAVAEPSWLEALVKPFGEDPRIAVVGSRVVKDDGSGLYAAALEILYGGVCVVHEGNRRIDAVSGCALAIRRDVFDSLGGLAADLFMYGEDLDLGHRTRAAGYRIGYARESLARHAVARRDRASSRNYMYYMARNRTLVCVRNYRRKRAYLIADVLVLFPLTSLTEFLRSRRKGRALRWLFEARVDSLRESLAYLRAARGT